MREQEREKFKEYVQSHSDRKIQSMNFPIRDFSYSRKIKISQNVFPE